MSLIQGGSDIKTTVMDHHGLVAAVCRDLGIIDKIRDLAFNRLPSLG